MSSSSSIAAARRRRAGGAGGPTPQQSNPVQQQQTPPPSNAPINPFTILQQHHIKINKLEQIIQEIIVSKETGHDITSSSSAKKSSSPSSPSSPSKQSDVNIIELSDLIMTRVEQQLDLKVFYENDERLMNEIEGLKRIIQSQQLVINGCNNTLYTILDKLNISAPYSSDIVDTTNIFEETNSSTNEKVTMEAFPKSVVIDEASNTIKEFIASSMKEEDDANLSVIQQ
jgi:hypothetical protein